MMRRLACAATGLAFLVASASGAEQYNVAASAGNAGDSHGGNIDDPDAVAEFERSEKGAGFELYQAGADASSGSVHASAARTDPLPPAAISTSAAANIQETIHFDELPDESVTIRAILGVAVTASRNVGFANASARLDVGGCFVTKSHNAVSGPSSGGNCQGEAADSIELVVTRDQLIQVGGEIDIEVNVSASLESQGGIDAEAQVSGGVPLSRGGGPVPGVVYLELDPPLAISFTGSQTSFPPISAPEPAAPALAAAGGLVLLAARRRAR